MAMAIDQPKQARLQKAALQAISLANAKRATAHVSLTDASDAMAAAVKEADRVGIKRTQIALEAGLSRRAVYDILGEG